MLIADFLIQIWSASREALGGNITPCPASLLEQTPTIRSQRPSFTCLPRTQGSHFLTIKKTGFEYSFQDFVAYKIAFTTVSLCYKKALHSARELENPKSLFCQSFVKFLPICLQSLIHGSCYSKHLQNWLRYYMAQ